MTFRSRPRRKATPPGRPHGRLATVPIAAVLAVVVTGAGAAAACERWLFGPGQDTTRPVAHGSSGGGSATPKPADSSSSTTTGSGGNSSAAGSARRSGLKVVEVEDGVDLGKVSGRFVLAPPTDLRDGPVLFRLAGERKLKVVDRRAPYAVTIDPRRMRLRDGEYEVRIKDLGDRSAEAIKAKLTISNGSTPRPTSSTSGPTKPVPTSTSTSSSTTRTGTSSTTKTGTTSTSTSTSTSTKTSSAPPAPAPPVGNDAAEVVRLTNLERAAGGCRPLTANSKLAAAAQAHSEDMAANNYFSHTGRDGRSPFQRMQDAGYVFRLAAENIAAGQPTPADVVRGWMNSSGHRANIMNCGLAEIGVGVAKGGSYRIYWTQNFGTPR